MLDKLYLHQNQLSGSIPEQIFSLSNLTSLYINHNNLVGTIPENINELESIERLRLQNNNLSGLIPETICTLDLEWDNTLKFNISNNRLCAPYPDCIIGEEGVQDTSSCNEVASIETLGIPCEFGINKAYPNPFNPHVTVEYTLEKETLVEVRIYDILGKKVQTLVNGFQKAGQNKIRWQGKDDNGNKVSAGIYYLHLSSDQRHQTIKLIFVK